MFQYRVLHCLNNRILYEDLRFFVFLFSGHYSTLQQFQVIRLEWRTSKLFLPEDRQNPFEDNFLILLRDCQYIFLSLSLLRCNRRFLFLQILFFWQYKVKLLLSCNFCIEDKILLTFLLNVTSDYRQELDIELAQGDITQYVLP